MTVSNAFVTMFNDEVTHSAQTLASNLVGAVRTVRNVTGSTYKFPLLGKSGAIKNKTSHQDIEAISAYDGSPTSGSLVEGDLRGAFATSKSATIDTYSVGEYIDDFDALKTNVDLRSAYAESLAGAMNRAYDNAIITALDTSVGAEILAAELSGNTLDKAGLLTIHKALNDQSVPMAERYIVCGPEAYNDVITSLANEVAGPFSQALVTGMLPNAVGFNIIMSTGLSDGAASDKKCYAFSKNAVGMAVGKDITTMVNYVPQKLSTLIASEFSGGAVVIDPKAVVSFQA